MSTASTERLRVFTYVQVERAPLYRAVMRTFLEAKVRFALHMRPKDVLAALAGSAAELEADEATLDQALEQLCAWGNLEAHPDTADVTTVEDFYRRRFLYQLTPEGEAAERALDVYHQTLEMPGELQTAALTDIRALLEELLQLATAGELDDGKVHRTLRALAERFDELTRRAQLFIGSLQRTIDLQGADLDAFLAYKETLIDYLERFIGELVLATSEIAALVGRLEAADPERLLRVAARRDLVDAVEAADADRTAAFEAWHGRWRGLVAWFVGGDGVSQAEILRSRARAAIPALLTAVESIHDRRLTRSDRSADLRTLARWFAEADSDRDAHRLWRAAFGLSSSRHLRIDAATLDLYDQHPVPASASWLEAPPLVISPRLRKTGRHTRPGRPSQVIDRSREKALLAELAAAEAEQIAAARRRLVRGRMLLSEVGELDTQTFALFLDLLGEALSRRVHPGDTVETTSSDGALGIVLAPSGGGGMATIETPHGRFTGRDCVIIIHDLAGGGPAEPAPRVVLSGAAP